jgi:hypothetical protein
MGAAIQTGKKNLLLNSSWQNGAAGYSDALFSLQGESFRRNLTAIAGGALTGFADKLVQGKIYYAQQEFQNQADAVSYPGMCTANVNTGNNGQIFIPDGGMNSALGTKVKTSLALCAGVNTNTYYRTKNSSNAGQSFKVIRPRLYEDTVWTNNIFNGSQVKFNQNNWLLSNANYVVDSNGIFTVTNTSGNGSIYQQINTVIGKTYTLSFNHKDGTAGCGVRIETVLGSADLLTVSYNDTSFNTRFVTFVATTTTTYIRIRVSLDTVGNTTFLSNIVLLSDMVFNKLKNHFRADCCTVNNFSQQFVPTIYNTLGTTAIQNTGTKQPLHVYNTLLNVGNKDYLNFDGIDDTLQFTESITNQFDLWFIASGLPTVKNAANPLFCKGTGSDVNRNISINFGHILGLCAFYYDSVGNATVLTNSIATYPPATGINIIRYVFDTTIGSRLYLNGNLLSSNSNKTIPKNTTNNCYFASIDGTQIYLPFKLNEYLSFNQLTDSEASKIYTYLRQRYGSDLNC